jgi:uncharacterized protein (DUF488 family)
MEVYSIGFTKKTAEQFFGVLKKTGIRRLVDVRLNNRSQLAGFSKREDLQYFLREICGTEYLHEPLLAPTQEMLSAYRRKQISWSEYEKLFLSLMVDRQIQKKLEHSLFSVPTVLLCSEPKPDRCHRRLVLEYLRGKWSGLEVYHL